MSDEFHGMFCSLEPIRNLSRFNEQSSGNEEKA